MNNILVRVLVDTICLLPLVWHGAPSQPAWRPRSPPSTATLKPSWSSSTSAETSRRTWRSSRSCWSWTLRSRCGTCISALCRALPRSCWTCRPTSANCPTPPSSWTSTTCPTSRERSTARGASRSNVKKLCVMSCSIGYRDNYCKQSETTGRSWVFRPFGDNSLQQVEYIIHTLDILWSRKANRL